LKQLKKVTPNKIIMVKKTASKAKKTTTKSKKSASKATTKATAPVEAVAAAPAAPEVVATPAPPSLAETFAEVLGQLQALRSQLTSVTGQVRALQKRADREVKQAQKKSNKRAKRSGNRAPSGFVKPTRISSELASFLGKPKGTEMARTEVTREINKYIVANSLQDKKNGRVIHPDTKLRKLLKLGKNDELTYFNLQRYMSPHFATAKNTKVASQ
jgi:chromatin remodeling complex protein RSC6